MIHKQLIFPLIREICSEENIIFQEEPTRGIYGVFLFEDGRHYYIKDINLNINSNGSIGVAKNKALTSYFLKLFGYSVPEFTMVYANAYCKKHNINDTLEQGFKFAHFLRYPIIVKLNDSSKGRGIFKVENDYELENAANIILKGNDCFQIQRYYNMNDYRVVVLGNEIISAYRRIPLQIVGDGLSSVKELIDLRQQDFIKSGRDTILSIDEDIILHLYKQNLTLDDILKRGEKVILRDVSNLSAGGMCEDLTNKIHPQFKVLCQKIAKDLDLKLCGIDLMCQDLCSPVDKYIVLEVNSSPGLDNYAFAGKKQIEYVKELYRKLIFYIKNDI